MPETANLLAKLNELEFSTSLVHFGHSLGNDFLVFLTSPTQRLFWGYILATLVLIGIFVVWQTLSKSTASPTQLGYKETRILPMLWKSLNTTLSSAFGRQVWLHNSSKLDIKIWLINIVIRAWLIVPLLLSVATVAIAVNSGLSDLFSLDVTGQKPLFLRFIEDTTPSWLVFTSMTLLLFLLDDFSRFFLHWTMHKIPFLWSFHQVHHSAEVLTPITVYRTHPVESFLYAMRLAFVNGLALGIAVFLFGTGIGFGEVLGANIGVFIFNMVGANLRHSHIRLSFGHHLEKWFISPAQHQIHHSADPDHYDTNFGTALAVWDRMFGCLVLNKNVKEKLTFGCDIQIHTLQQAYLVSFTQALKHLSENALRALLKCKNLLIRLDLSASSHIKKTSNK